MLREAVRLPAYASRAITQRSATDGIAKALSRRLLGHAEHGRDPMHRNGVGHRGGLQVDIATAVRVRCGPAVYLPVAIPIGDDSK